jgi:hypothetical protein
MAMVGMGRVQGFRVQEMQNAECKMKNKAADGIGGGRRVVGQLALHPS